MPTVAEKCLWHDVSLLGRFDYSSVKSAGILRLFLFRCPAPAFQRHWALDWALFMAPQFIARPGACDGLALSMLGKPRVCSVYCYCIFSAAWNKAYHISVTQWSQANKFTCIGCSAWDNVQYVLPLQRASLLACCTFVVIRVTTYSMQLSSRGVRIFPKTFQVVASRRGVTSFTRKKLLELIEQEDPLPISSSLSDSFLLLERSGKHTTGQTYLFKADGRICCVV